VGGRYGELPEEELRKVCKELGFSPGGLEDREAVPALLEQLERLERRSVSDLRNEIRKRGFATTPGMVKEGLVQRLRDILIWERLRVGELRRVCRELGLALQDVEPTRENLLTLLSDATWQLRGIPVWRLSSLILAFGVLDQVDVLESKDAEELAFLCEKRGLPVEDEPDQAVLAERLRTLVVWEHFPLEELRRECEVMGVPMGDLEAQRQDQRRPPSGGQSAGIMFRGTSSLEKDEQKELVRRLSELFWQAPPAPSAGELLAEDDPRYPEQVSGFLERLRLAPTAGSEDLKRAYKEMARKLHPDKNIGNEEHVTAEFQGVSEAYEALSEYMRRCGI